ncbi:MAG: VanZ family protein [Gemmatimonadaceae bacterium]
MPTRHRLLAARLAYVGIVLIATLMALHFSPDLGAARARLARALAPALSWRDAVDGLRNVVLFGGLGAVWVVTSPTGDVRREIGRATIVSAALGATIEAVQLFSPVRMASIVDVTTNAIGGFAGAVATVLLLGAIQRARSKRSYVGVPTLLAVGPYGIAVLCEALAPLFHSEPMPSLDGSPLTRLGFALSLALPLDWREIPVFDVPLYAALGFLLVAYARERRAGSARPDWLTALGAALIVVAAQVAHGAFGLVVRWEVVATDVLSIAIGAFAARRWLGILTRSLRGAARARAVLAAYASLLVLWGWRPLLPEDHWQAMQSKVSIDTLTPLASLAERVDVFSAAHVGQQFFLYLPLGALLAVWPLRRAGWMRHLWPGVWLAGAIELGHIAVSERTFDVTNCLIAAAGLGMGWIAIRRCGYKPYGEAIPAVAERSS